MVLTFLSSRLVFVSRTFNAAALERVAADAKTRVEEAAVDCADWTAAQFASAALLLLNTPNHAVTRGNLEVLLGSHITDDDDTSKQQASGWVTLKALVKANVLSLRPDSEWALDIPHDRFRASAVIVTAASAVDLYAMKCMRPQLEQIVKQWEQVCSCS
jgi:hypothetical protein